MSTYDQQLYTSVLYIKSWTQGIYLDTHGDLDINSYRSDNVILFTWDAPQVTR